MRILGIDPGAKTGWCVYDNDHKRVLGSGEFQEFYAHSACPPVVEHLRRITNFNYAVVERLVPHGASYPQVVEAAYVAGRLVERVSKWSDVVVELARHEIRGRLQAATHGAVRVKNDATVWAALKLLHGDGCDKKGGSLYGVKSHARAALAAAVAFTLPAEKGKEAT